MSFGFGIGDFLAVLELVSEVRTRYASAPEQIKEIHSSITSLFITLTNLDDLSPPASNAPGGVRLSDRQTEDLKHYSVACKSVLNKLKVLADRNQEIDKTGGARHGFKRAWQRLKWSPSDIADLRDQLTNVSVMLNTFYASLTQQTVSDVLETAKATYDTVLDNQAIIIDTKAGIDAMATAQMSRNRRAFLSWLSPNDFGGEWTKIIESRTPGTGQWLLDSAEFTEWKNEPGRILFSSGMPGAGKTMIAAIVVDHLISIGDPAIGIACTFCKYGRIQEQSLQNILASLLEQLLKVRTDLDHELNNLFAQFESQKQGELKATRPTTSQLVEALSVVARNSSKLCIIVDALDECTDEHGTRSQLSDELLLLRETTSANIFVTTREDPTSRARMNDLFIEIRASDEDVLAYLRRELPHKGPISKCLASRPDLKSQVEVEIVKAVRGMFLLAKLHLDDLAQKTTAKSIKLALVDLPKGLQVYDETYRKVQTRINEQPQELRDLAQRVISWLVYAQRELKLLELQHALAVEEGDRALDEDNIVDADILTSVCAGIVIVDEHSGIIRFVHYTTKEYFQSICDTWDPHPPTEIAKTCLTYLNFDALSVGFNTRKLNYIWFRDLWTEQKLLLLPYVSEFWANHISTARNDQITDLAVAFLTDNAKVSCAAQSIGYILERKRSPATLFETLKIGAMWTGAHFASSSGATGMLKLLLESGNSLSEEDSNGHTPLWWAAWAGKLDVVRFLIQQGQVDLETRRTHETPLDIASRNGFVDIVAFLIGLDQADTYNGRHLVSAAYYAIEGAVDLIVSGADSAILGRHEATAIRLLKNEKSAAIVCSDYVLRKDILFHTLRTAMIGVIELCGGQDIPVDDLKNKQGRTPLSLAAHQGHLRAVQFLLGRGASPNLKDGNGRTPISWAAGRLLHRNQLLVMQELLNIQDVHVDEADDKGRTALHYAASVGGVEYVKMLLAKGARRDRKDIDGLTPLAWFARSDRLRSSDDESMFDLLAAAVNVDESDNLDRTPLSYAAEASNIETVTLLLGRGARHDRADNQGRTPLAWARKGLKSRGKQCCILLEGLTY